MHYSIFKNRNRLYNEIFNWRLIRKNQTLVKYISKIKIETITKNISFSLGRKYPQDDKGHKW